MIYIILYLCLFKFNNFQIIANLSYIWLHSNDELTWKRYLIRPFGDDSSNPIPIIHNTTLGHVIQPNIKKHYYPILWGYVSDIPPLLYLHIISYHHI
jgi:hypothetical protein